MERSASPQWSIRIWDRFVEEHAASHAPEWVRITFLKYWSITDKWFGD